MGKENGQGIWKTNYEKPWHFQCCNQLWNFDRVVTECLKVLQYIIIVILYHLLAN